VNTYNPISNKILAPTWKAAGTGSFTGTATSAVTITVNAPAMTGLTTSCVIASSKYDYTFTWPAYNTTWPGVDRFKVTDNSDGTFSVTTTNNTGSATTTHKTGDATLRVGHTFKIQALDTNGNVIPGASNTQTTALSACN